MDKHKNEDREGISVFSSSSAMRISSLIELQFDGLDCFLNIWAIIISDFWLWYPVCFLLCKNFKKSPVWFYSIIRRNSNFIGPGLLKYSVKSLSRTMSSLP